MRRIGDSEPQMAFNEPGLAIPNRRANEPTQQASQDRPDRKVRPQKPSHNPQSQCHDGNRVEMRSDGLQKYGKSLVLSERKI